jgi:hypothetical protein
MFPQFAVTISEFNDAIDENSSDFHLDYDEHLRPYIDGKINEVDREIIESHLQFCALCLHQVRDLREFKQSLELQSLKDKLAKEEQESLLTKFGNWLNEYSKILTFAGLLVVFGLLGLWAFLNFRDQTKQLTKNENQIANNNPINSILQETPDPTPLSSANINVNSNANNKNNNANVTKPHTNTVIDEKLPENELATLILPEYLKDLRLKPRNVRSPADLKTEIIRIISPNGKVIREESPLLNWTKIKGVQNYEISISDENLNELKKEIVSVNQWRVPLNLTKGGFFNWQVSAQSDNKEYLGKGKFYVISQASKARINQAKDSLERGKAFAEAGLLDEAKIEFRQYLKQNPSSQTARKLLQKVESFK